MKNYIDIKGANVHNLKNVSVKINMFLGDGEATAWGCDLTYDYVKINGDYRT